MTGSWVDRRIEFSWYFAGVGLGDVLVIAGFVLAGMAHHGTIGQPPRVAGTLGSFLVGWALVALAGGLYTTAAVVNWRSALVRTLPAWLLAVVVAQGLRATGPVPGDASVTFALVSVVAGWIALAGWRVLVAEFL